MSNQEKPDDQFEFVAEEDPTPSRSPKPTKRGGAAHQGVSGDLLDQVASSPWEIDSIGAGALKSTPTRAPGAQAVDQALASVPRPKVDLQPEALIPLTSAERADPNFHPAPGPVAPASATPKASAVTGSISTYKPSVRDRLRDMVANSAVGHAVEQGLPKVADALNIHPTETVYSPEYQQHKEQLISPEELIDPNSASIPSRVSRGVLGFGGSLTTPDNLTIMATTQGLGLLGKAAPTVSRLISAGFSYQMLKGAVDQYPQLKDAINKGDYGAAAETLTKMGLAVGMAAQGVKHAAGDVYGSEIGKIPRTGRTVESNPAPIPSVAAPQSRVAPEVQQAAASMARAQQADVMAQRVARGMPPVPVPPPAPAPPPVTAEVVQQVGEHIESLPKEQQAKAIVEAHGELAKNLLQQGRVVTPDSQLHIVKSPDQADTLAASIINNEVKRRDQAAPEAQKPALRSGGMDEAALKSATDMGAGRLAAKAVAEHVQEAWKPEVMSGETAAEESRNEVVRPGGGLPDRPAEPTPGPAPAEKVKAQPFEFISEERAKQPFSNGDRIKVSGIDTPATVKYMNDASGLRVLRVEFDEPTKVPWDSKPVTKANVPTKYQGKVTAFSVPAETEPESLAGELATSESGQFEPGKIGAAAGKGTGAIGDYLRSEAEANKRARKLQSGMYDLESQHQGTVLRAVQAMERTGKEYGKNLAADSEAVYHHLENPEGHELTPEQDNLLDNHVLPVMEDTDTKFARLKELLGQDANLVGNYVHRVVKDKGDWLDRAAAGQKGGTGRGNLLSKSAPQTKGRTMMALEDADGTRRVVSVKGGEVTAWDAGKSEKLGEIGTESQNIREQVSKINQRVRKLEDERRTLLATPSRVKVTFERRKNITEEIDQLEREREKIEYSTPESALQDRVFLDDSGKKWKLTQATTEEIEANTGLRYFHNALASALVSNIQITKALRGAEFVESFKNSPEFKDIAFHRGDGNPPDKWKPTELPQLRDYYFEPHTAETLKWYAERVKGHDPSAYDQIGNFLRTSIFFNPLLHTPNITVHWAVEKGLRGYMPDRWLASYRAGVKAINAVTHQNQDFLDALDAGAPLQSQREDVAKVTGLFFESLTKGLKSEEPWATRLAKQVGMAPVDLVKGIYRFSGKATWTTNDVAFLQAAYEKVEQGMPLKQALTETAKHIPDYRLPTRILNSPTIAKVMSNPALTMFGQYHYGALRSYGEMAKSALGISDVPGRSKAAEVGHGWEMLATLGLVTFVVYPMIDRALQEATGNKNARLRRAGAATFPWNIQQLAKHEKTPTEVLEATATPAVHTKTGIEVITNHNWRTGREIRDPLADWHTQAQQVGRHLAEAISPVGAASRWAEGGPEARKRLAYGFLGVSFAKTHAEKLASDIAAKKMSVEAETPEQRAAYSRRYEILDALRKGDDRPLSQAIQKRELNSAQARQLRHRAILTPLQDRVRNFTYSEVWRVYEAANPDEKEQLEHTLRRKRAELFEKSRGEEVRETEAQQ